MYAVKFKNYDCKLQFAKYSNERIAIILADKTFGENIAIATVNLPEIPLENDEIIIKNWSENEGMLETLEEAKIVKRINQVPTGFVMADICKLLIKI